MVEDDVLMSATAYCVGVVTSLIAQTHTYIAYYYLVGTYVQRMTLQGDAVAGCRLASDGDIGMAYGKRTLQVYSARHSEYHRARSFRLYGCAQAAFTAVVQISNLIHLAATTSNGIFAIALGCRECQLLCHARCGKAKQQGTCQNSHYRFFHLFFLVVYECYFSQEPL